MATIQLARERSGRVDLDHFFNSEFRASFLVTSAAPIKQDQVLRQRGRKQCQIEFYVLNVMAKEEPPALHVVALAKHQS